MNNDTFLSNSSTKGDHKGRKSYPEFDENKVTFSSNVNKNFISSIIYYDANRIDYRNSKENITTNSFDEDNLTSVFLKDYLTYISYSSDVFLNVAKKINRVTNNSVKKSLIQFITDFQFKLGKTIASNNLSNVLPPFFMEEEEDGTVFLEWVFRDFRVGFVIEHKYSESSWFLITNKNLEEQTFSGKIDHTTISRIIKFVLLNS